MNDTVTIRFYQELNFFLPRDKQKQDFTHKISRGQTVKDMIESEGVPHVEVDLILVNGESVDFTYRIQSGDRISVYPVFERFDISGITKLRPIPLRKPRFILDVHLKPLARKLRLLGYDTKWEQNADDPELALTSQNEGRILLTRDKGLLMRKIITHGLYVHNTDPKKQIAEVVDKLSLARWARPFTLCVNCNGRLKTISEENTKLDEILMTVPDGVKNKATNFYQCIDCGKIYWEGSHIPHIIKWMKDIGIQIS